MTEFPRRVLLTRCARVAVPRRRGAALPARLHPPVPPIRALLPHPRRPALPEHLEELEALREGLAGQHRRAERVQLELGLQERDGPLRLARLAQQADETDEQVCKTGSEVRGGSVRWGQRSWTDLKYWVTLACKSTKQQQQRLEKQPRNAGPQANTALPVYFTSTPPRTRTDHAGGRVRPQGVRFHRAAQHAVEALEALRVQLQHAADAEVAELGRGVAQPVAPHQRLVGEGERDAAPLSARPLAVPRVPVGGDPRQRQPHAGRVGGQRALEDGRADLVAHRSRHGGSGVVAAVLEARELQPEVDVVRRLAQPPVVLLRPPVSGVVAADVGRFGGGGGQTRARCHPGCVERRRRVIHSQWVRCPLRLLRRLRRRTERYVLGRLPCVLRDRLHLRSDGVARFLRVFPLRRVFAPEVPQLSQRRRTPPLAAGRHRRPPAGAGAETAVADAAVMRHVARVAGAVDEVVGVAPPVDAEGVGDVQPRHLLDEHLPAASHQLLRSSANTRTSLQRPYARSTDWTIAPMYQ